jgi:FG-GAP repeat
MVKPCRDFAFVLAACLTLAGCGADPEFGTPMTFQEVKALAASDLADMDEFGWPVAIDGDSIAVAASCERGEGVLRGAVYLYERNRGGTDAWGEVKKITAGDAQDYDRFGYSIAIEGDVLAVGSVRGGVYIYYRGQGGADQWGEVTRIVGSDTGSYDHFGRSLALAGDRLIVGAPDHGGSGYSQGAAYIFYRDLGGIDAWGQVAKLMAGDAHDFESLGSSVAISGEHAVVGAVGGDVDDTGSAYVFARTRGGEDAWGQVVKITASDAQPQDEFGNSVVIQGDTIVVGAPCEDGQGGIGDNPGAVYIFSRNRGGTDAWGEVLKLSRSDGTGAFFGISAGLSGNYLVVGALYNGGTGANRDFGAVYFFSRNEGGTDAWGLLNQANASDGEEMDFLGMSAAIDGNLAVAGAPDNDGIGTNRGAAYIFKRTTQTGAMLN